MDFNKLTVPQLKALCKDKKITGYSKLNKLALVAKLQQDDEGNSSASRAGGSILPVTDAVPLPEAAHTTGSVGLGAASAGSQSVEKNSGQATDLEARAILRAHFETTMSGDAQSIKVSEPPEVTNTTRRGSSSRIPTSGAIERPLAAAEGRAGALTEVLATSGSSLSVKQSWKAPRASANPTKRKNEVALENSKTKRARNVILVPTIQTPAEKPPLKRPKPSLLYPISSAPAIQIPQGAHPLKEAPILVIPPTAAPISTRRTKKAFAPLVPKLPPGVVYLPVSLRDPIEEARSNSSARVTGQLSGGLSEARGLLPLEAYFQLPLGAPVPSLRPITLPPSISQRKKVQRISLILSLLYEEDLNAFSSLCRLYRYSAYVAASHILRRGFSGQRLDEVFKKYSPNMTNLWPYLRQRQKEAQERKDHFCNTFLGKALKKYPSIICLHLWSVSSHQKQIGIAVRFLLTCFYYHVSIGLDVMFDRTTILAATEVSSEEIWKITLRIGSAVHYYYVLEATCEVVGLPSISSENIREASNPDRRSPLVRADWTDYIEHKLQSVGHPSSRKLEDHLSWPNHEEYDQGISKNWLGRIKQEGESGVAKLFIAKRYVLACLVANSLSGRVMTSIDMEQEFNGMPLSVGAQHKSKKRPNLSLFLPSHHLVESLHTTSRTMKPLHPAIAVVQTPGREYYILRDNGMQIGCEEDGVSPVWMDILFCDEGGVARNR